MSTFDIGLFNNSYTVQDTVSLASPDDLYNFTLTSGGGLQASFGGMSFPLNWQLKDSGGSTLQSGLVNATNPEAINLYNLTAGNYSLQVSQEGGDTPYTLKLDPLTNFNFDSGFFTVGQTGQVGFDFLLDGGWYRSELAIFNMRGIETFNPGSSGFIKEATRRALSNSTEGYVVISDPTEGAKLTATFPGEGNLNTGEYKGIKTFAMTPGDKFGILLVPNGTVQEVFDNPSIGGNKRPLFSLATANPNDAFHVGQIADVTKDGKTFAMEDLRYDLGSDKDYNDFLFRVTGARGVAIALDEVIDPQKDWRGTTVGTDLRNYVNTPPQLLQFKLNSSYRVGETVNLTDAKVFDENGDISKVVFKLKKPDGSEVTNEINNFTFNEDWASFNYALSGLVAGSYELTAIASDQLGQSTSPFAQSFQVQQVNNPPIDLQFTIPQSTYNIGDSINLIGAKVYDADGISDLAKVDFEIKKDSGELVKKQSVTNFTSDSGDNRWGNFSYSLSGLGVGSYELRAIAYDKSGAFSNSFSQNFTVNAPVVVPPNTAPQYLQFGILPSYNVGEIVNLTGGKVYDSNGASDLARVDFKLKKDGGDWEDISDVISFTADTGDNGWGNFNYSLSGLGLGNYVLEAIAYDQSNANSSAVTASFTINPVPERAPEGLQFSILPIYNNDETISFNGGKVFDANGVGDIDNVDFWLRHPDGTWFDIADATQFTADSRGRGRFNYSYDLKGLAPGRYQLWAIANDKSYNYSQPFVQNFSVITAAGETELADEERIAIANAANLNKYTPEELAKTREWVVWVTPGQSSSDLAQQIAAQDKGATGYIPNTYTWEFPEDISADEVMQRLNSVRGVELYYPLVPVESELLSDPLVQQPGNLNPTYPLSDPNDPNLRNFLNSYQWHLRTGVNPTADANVTAAWNLAKGNGVVIGIVDDGLDFTHLDLRDRYRADLSWDFNENDENPSPSYNRTIFASGLPNRIRDDDQTNFRLDVPLTGVVSDANVRLDIGHLRVSDLQGLVDSPNDPVFNPLIGRGTGGNGRIIGGNGGDKYPVLLFDNVGGDGDNFTNTIFDDQANRWISQGVAPFTGSFKPLGNLADFNQQWVQGWWNLRIKDKMRVEAGRLNYWGLELQTYNPHGTPVAGIAAASNNNGIGGSGVAPLASLAGLRLIADEANDLQIAGALSYQAQDIDIYNNSWKLEDWLTKSPLGLRAMRDSSNFGRATLGNIYVFGAGNDQWVGGNVNYNGFANSRYALPVAAIDHTGKQTIYSEPGASLLVSAYSSSSGVGITTTDLVGNNGYNGYPNNDYTNRFGGTSASAPFVSGVVALMLEANPTLSWRDVQHILVRTAKKNDPTDFDWRTNGAGYHVNHKYGFGAIDAEAAVRLAQSWTSVGNETMVSSGLQNVLEDIPDGDEQTGVRSNVLISDDITVEKVEVVFNTDHRDWRDLKVVLKSPDGTESILADSISSDPNAENSYQLQGESGLWSFTSVRHWGESSRGEWQLQVFDREGNQIQGQWNTWKLNLYGTKPTVSISATDANATEGGDPGQFTVTRTGSTKYDLTVNYTIAGTATNSTDYNTISGSVIIRAGATSARIAIAPIDDAVYEGNETVIASLTADNAYTVGSQSSEIVEIADNDPQPIPTVVTNTNDSGIGSLRDAINWANTNPGKDTIRFNIPTTDPGYDTVTRSFTIRPTSALPIISDSVVIDGTTQLGFTGRPIIELDGSNAGFAPGLQINANNNSIRGFAINRFGIGVSVRSNGNVIEGNYIGTNVTGTQSLGNAFEGLAIFNGSNNKIGGTTSQTRNIISGNGWQGVVLYGNSTANLVQGNYIGTDITGTRSLGNSRHGIFIPEGSNNIIGGRTAAEGNIIAFNNGGVNVAQGINNAILYNSIFSNNDLGIRLGASGGNNLQNFPVLTSAASSGGSTTIIGRLNSTANKTFRLEFFSNSALDPSGYGEGQRFIGYQNVTTNSSGNASFTVNLPTSLVGQFITATATDPNNNTSEFSQGIQVTNNTQLSIDRVSVASDETPGNNTGSSGLASAISQDGRFVAFESDATNLVLGDTNGLIDVFVRDRVTGTTERVNIANNGTQANNVTRNVSISGDGRFVVFDSLATNLVPGDTNRFRDVFVRDRATGTTRRVSVASNGIQGNGDSRFASISQNGRFIAFESDASNLVSGDTNGRTDIFVYDLLTSTTKRVSVGSANRQANGSSSAPSISADGRFIAFESNASNLPLRVFDTNNQTDIFVYDQSTNSTELVSSTLFGIQSGNSFSLNPSISADGNFIAFESNASNLVAGDTNGYKDLFVYNRLTGLIERVNVANNGIQWSYNSVEYKPSISGDGRFVTFTSSANLVPGDMNNQADVFVRDRTTGITRLVSHRIDGIAGNLSSINPSISADGRFVSFTSRSLNLVPRNPNGFFEDIYVRQL